MAIPARTEVDLLQAARGGDETASTELYVRHHAAALRLAQTFRRCGDPDDLVNGAFERVLGALRRGSGPTESFRAYLFVTLRRLALEQAPLRREESIDEVPEPVMAAAEAADLERAERAMVTEAFESLPDRWQAVLWHTAVEGRQPREFAGAVGMSANAAAALAYRARERLRQAYLQAHLQTRAQPRCEPHRSRLGGFVREGLSRRDSAATRAHLERCETCRELATELTDVNRLLVRSLVPAFTVAGGGAAALAGARSAAASVRLAAGAGTTAAGGASGAVDGASTGLRRTTAAVGAVAAAAAAVVALSVTLLPHDGGPGGAPDAAWEAGAPPGARQGGSGSGSGPATASVTTGAAAGDGPVSTGRSGEDDGPGPGSASTTASADAVASTGIGPLSAEVELGLGLAAGDGDVAATAEAGVQLGVDLRWERRLLGNGTLEIVVPNDGSETAPDVAIDVQLSADARASQPLSGTCEGSSGNSVDAVLDLVTSLTCGLGDLGPGASATIRLEVQVTAPSQSATVTVRTAGRVVGSDAIALPQ